MNSEFVKLGNLISPKPEGIDYDLEVGRIYKLKYVRGWDSHIELVCDGTIDLPEKVYYSEAERNFINKITNYYNKYTPNTLGVMLHGKQGCGKTLFAKNIAINLNLPIIVVDPSFSSKMLTNYFTKFKTPVCIMFDELDKHLDDEWDSEEMLEFLDGVQTTCKKVVLFTCNDDEDVTKFMKNRCGRIRYYRNFKELDDSMIREIVSDVIKNKDNIDKVCENIKKYIELPSYDIITSVMKDINDYPDSDFLDIIADLNINVKKTDD